MKLQNYIFQTNMFYRIFLSVTFFFLLKYVFPRLFFSSVTTHQSFVSLGQVLLEDKRGALSNL